MRKFIYLLSFSLYFSSFHTVNAQESYEDLPSNYKERHPIYDYSDKELSNTDSIPDFASKSNPLKITGTVFLSDGVTPAKDVILFINQADEHGNYELKKHFKKRYVHHRGWVKTDADGHYTFYTFVPGRDRHSNDLKKIHLAIKPPDEVEYVGDDFLFEDDPLLKKSCRKRLDENGIDSILKAVKIENMHVATKNIILKENRNEYAKN